MINKINLGSSLAALILFFLPWIDITCAEKRMATQSGFQSIYGDVSAAGAMSKKSDSDDDEIGWSIISLFTFAAVLGACAFAALAFFKGDPRGEFLTPVFCAIAFLLLIFQLMIDTPLEDKVDEAMEEAMEKAENDGLGQLAAMGVGIQIDSSRKLAFYLELLALAIPVGFLIKRRMDENPALGISDPKSAETEPPTS